MRRLPSLLFRPPPPRSMAASFTQFSLSLGPLFLQSTPSLRKYILNVLECRQGVFSEEEISLATEYANSKNGDAIPYYLLKLCSQNFLKEGKGEDRIWLHEAVDGSNLALVKPRIPEKSDELKARLAILQDGVDRKEYEEMVKDVTRHERKLKEAAFLGTYREALSFGVHVIVVMGTCFAFCFVAFRSQFPNNPVMHAAGGILGLISGLFVEVFLFIIRAARYEEEAEKSKTQRKKRKIPTASSESVPLSSGSGSLGSSKSWQTGVRPRRKVL